MAKKPTLDVPAHWALDVRPAPGDLMLVQDFVNTAPGGPRGERLGSPAALTDWLSAWSLPCPDGGAGDGDLRRAVEVRDDLLHLVRANPAGLPDDGVLPRLDDAVAAITLHPRLGPGGLLRLEPAGNALDRVFGRLVDAVLQTQRLGEWPRMKLCENGECVVAYFSPPRMTRWCSSRCRNRIAKRASRRRRGRE